MHSALKRIVVPVVLTLICLCSSPSLAGKQKAPVTVREGSTVTIDYAIVVGDVVVESSERSGPLVFTVGRHEVIEGLEKAVIGMKVGEYKAFKVPPEEGYGRPTEPVQEIPLGNLPPGVVPEKNLVLILEDATGHKRFVTIVEVRDKTVVVDLNHPLAGKELDCQVKVIEIK